MDTTRRSALATGAIAGAAILSACVGPDGRTATGPNAQTTIDISFEAAQVGLIALGFVPAVPAIVVQGAQAILNDLRASYANYVSTPNITYTTAVEQQTARAVGFLATQGKVALRHAGVSKVV